MDRRNREITTEGENTVEVMWDKLPKGAHETAVGGGVEIHLQDRVGEHTHDQRYHQAQQLILQELAHLARV